MIDLSSPRSRNLVIFASGLFFIKGITLLLVGLVFTIFAYDKVVLGRQEVTHFVSTASSQDRNHNWYSSNQKADSNMSVIPLKLVDFSIEHNSPSEEQLNIARLPASTISRFQHYEPAGCKRPPDNYSRIKVGEAMINMRTYAMLSNAASIYNGSIDLLGPAVTQGVHENNRSHDIDTYFDAGVVDISVMSPGSTEVLYEEIDPLIKALRVAGFAAWLRDWDELYPGSEIHIHAVAIGDQELSEEAIEQLTGKFGYFRGYRGLPGLSPEIDRYGPPLICRWMLDEGYFDHRSKNSMIDMRWLSSSWQDTLYEVAQSYLTTSSEQTHQLARDLGFQGNGYEDPSNMCGPLSAVILRESGLLPWSVGPITDPTSFWLADPITNGRPWSLFPKEDYQLFHFDTPINRFNFVNWPLFPGDFIYTFSGVGEYSHMLVVTEVDSLGRAYTVTNQMQDDGHFLIQKILLYDPLNPEVGAFVNDWVKPESNQGRTGLGGFDVLRRNWVSLPSGTILAHIIEPGDTLPRIAARYSTSVEAIISHNKIDDPTTLLIGDHLNVPVNMVQTLNAHYK